MKWIETRELKEAGLVNGIVMRQPGNVFGVIYSKSNLNELAMA